VRAYKTRWPTGELGRAVNRCLEVLSAAEANRLLRPSHSPVTDPLLRPTANDFLLDREALVRVADTPEDRQVVQTRNTSVDG